jgi:SAM-dependent methyltransferase
MLAEHLSQEHDAASRRLAIIEAHVQWIHSELLGGESTRILDLCCGPGLYTSRLAALGHECVGIDFSPAAIAYAEEPASAKGLSCRYFQEDIRRADFGCGFGLVMLLYGQMNVFRREEARTLLEKARQALAEGGLLLLEPHTLTAVEHLGTSGPSWYSAAEGLFSPQTHLVLEENFWDAAEKAATARYLVIDAAGGSVTRQVLTTQGYSDDEYESLLKETGFSDVKRFFSLTGQEATAQDGLFVLSARAMAINSPDLD